MDVMKGHFEWTEHLLDQHIDGSRYYCDDGQCEKSFKHYHEFVVHFYECHLSMQYTCPCGAEFGVDRKGEADDHFGQCRLRGIKCRRCLKVPTEMGCECLLEEIDEN